MEWEERRPPQAREVIFEFLPINSRCAEIGVWRGDFSQQLLDKLMPVELHLVDPWLMYGSGQPMELAYDGVWVRCDD